jgi:MFS family permease
MALASVIVHIMPHLSVVGISRYHGGFIAASIPLLSIIGRFVFGWVGDRFDKRHVMILAYFFMVLGMFVLAFTHWPVMFFFFLLFFPLGFGGLTVLRGTIILEYYDKRNFGSMMGILMGFAAVGGIIGPTFTGWVFDLSGDYHFVWMGFSAMLIICILLIVKFRPKTSSMGTIIQRA